MALLLTGCDAISSNDADASVGGTIAYAHESNNRADLVGNGVTGQAIVNYAKGAPAEWRSTVNVQGDLDAGTYGFYVNLNGGSETLVCTFEVTESGVRQGCSADTDLPGFNTAVVRDADGVPFASGTFARRGGKRVE